MQCLRRASVTLYKVHFVFLRQVSSGPNPTTEPITHGEHGWNSHGLFILIPLLSQGLSIPVVPEKGYKRAYSAGGQGAGSMVMTIVEALALSMGQEQFVLSACCI